MAHRPAPRWSRPGLRPPRLGPLRLLCAWVACPAAAGLRGPASAAAAPRGDAATATVERLRWRLGELGLPRHGRKAELAERLAGLGHRVSAARLPESGRRAVLTALEGGAWRMSELDGYARPPRVLGRAPNPLRELGECGDAECALCRFREGCETVREDVLEFCAERIAAHARGLGGEVTYCSLGCGALHFDWRLLERLQREGVRVPQVWLLERCYRPGLSDSEIVLKARDAFTSWFTGSGTEVHAFKTAKALKQWVAAFPRAGQADVIMQCDAVDTHPILEADKDFRRVVARDGALGLQAFSQLTERRRPGPGRRRAPVPSVPVRRVLRRGGGEDAALLVLEEATWRRGRWVPYYEDLLGLEEEAY